MGRTLTIFEKSWTFWKSQYTGCNNNKFLQHIFPIFKAILANISTSDQYCFNVVNQGWNKVDPTLKGKQNLTLDFQRCITLIQRQCPTLKQRWNNVDKNFISTLFQRVLDISESYIKSSRASDKYGFINRSLRLILLNNFYNILKIQLLVN